jgi:hypothetical protein
MLVLLTRPRTQGRVAIAAIRADRAEAVADPMAAAPPIKAMTSPKLTTSEATTGTGHRQGLVSETMLKGSRPAFCSHVATAVGSRAR